MEIINSEKFYELMASDKIVVVDFFAVWCGPCKMQSPIMQEVQDYYKENSKIEVVKIDVDEQGEIALENGIMSIPTIIIFKNGKNVQKFIGLTDKDEICKAVDSIL